jgi:hypothetical protein
MDFLFMSEPKFLFRKKEGEMGKRDGKMGLKNNVRRIEEDEKRKR